MTEWPGTYRRISTPKERLSLIDFLSSKVPVALTGPLVVRDSHRNPRPHRRNRAAALTLRHIAGTERSSNVTCVAV
jgi:hypothetical protein